MRRFLAALLAIALLAGAALLPPQASRGMSPQQIATATARPARPSPTATATIDPTATAGPVYLPLVRSDP